MGTRSPQHPLTIVRLKVDLPTHLNEYQTRARMTGENVYAKDYLWRWEETWSYAERQAGIDPVDTLRWLLTIATQDHPRSQDHLQRQITHGEGWEQLEAFDPRP